MAHGGVVRHRLTTITFVVLAAFAATGAAAVSAAGDPAAWIVGRTSVVRDHHGLRHYRDNDRLTSVAQQWARWMAAHHELLHNPNLLDEVGNWCYAGENIGRGGSARLVQRELMHSPEHRANILSKHFTQVGIATDRDSAGHLYVDEVFRRPC